MQVMEVRFVEVMVQLDLPSCRKGEVGGRGERRGEGRRERGRGKKDKEWGGESMEKKVREGETAEIRQLSTQCQTSHEQ